MLFKVHIRRNGTDEVWSYDNLSNVVRDAKGVIRNPLFGQQVEAEPFEIFTPTHNENKPKCELSCIDITLGLNCNFNCRYCSQGLYKNKAYNGKPSDVEPFMQMLENTGITLKEEGKLTIWGGEPFVYWKTLKVLIPALRKKWPVNKITVLTNGSLLTKEKIDFCKEHHLQLSLSDDGLNEFRTKEAVAVAKKNDELFDYAARTLGNLFIVGMVPSIGNADVIRQVNAIKNRIPHLNRVYNQNVVRCFNLINNDPELSKSMFQMPDEDLIALHDSVYCEMEDRPIKDGNKPLDDFLLQLVMGQPLYLAAQCGVPAGDMICVNLRGDLFNCHARAALGLEIGHLSSYEKTYITGHTHWSKRDDCPKCPMVSICRGDCSAVSEEARKISCRNRFAHHFAVFRRHFAGIFGVFVEAIEPVEGEMMHANKLLNWHIPQNMSSERKIIPIVSG